MNHSMLLDDINDYKSPPIRLKKLAEGLSIHDNIKSNYWTLSLWNENDIQINKHDIFHDMDKIVDEMENDLINNKNTSPRPLKFKTYKNIILNGGQQLGIDKLLGVDTTNTLDWASLGSSATPEDVTQTGLTTEITGGAPAYARQQFSVDGTRSRTNQTMKLGVLWADTDLQVSPQITIREHGIHWGATGVNGYARLVTSNYTFTTGNILVTQINELNVNGVTT